MKIGRNDPCPCGSGKKYKKCCLEKDQATERARPAIPIQLPPAGFEMAASSSLQELPLARPPDPRADAIYARWQEFQEQDYESQIALFTRSLDEDLIDDESAFEMLNRIYYESAERDQRDRFDALAQALHERLPEVYAYDASFYLGWQITNALVAGRMDVIPALAREMAATADRHLDQFMEVIDMLAYHGQLAVIVAAMRAAWPLVQRSDVLEWAIDEFAESAVDSIVLDRLERGEALDARDPELIEQLEAYLPVDQQKLADYIALLTGATQREWQLGDFALDRTMSQGQSVEDQHEPNEAQNLYDLTVEFLGYLQREEGVPLSKGELGREQIQRYIAARAIGEIGRGDQEFAGPFRSKKHKQRPKAAVPEHLLCPDRRTLDAYLAGLNLDFSAQNYRIAATFELIPAWLRFLVSRGLIDAQQREQTLGELSALGRDLRKMFAEYQADPALQQAVRD
jgi:hypothetical protein